MDTISRGENTSMLPMGGLIAGILGLVLGAYAAFVAVPKTNKSIADLEQKLAKIDEVQSQVATVTTDVGKANREVLAVRGETNTAFKTVGDILSELRASVTKLEDAQKKAPAHAAGAAHAGAAAAEPAVAGPDEYIVKPGDTSGAKIARDHNVSLSDLMAVNPSVNWTKLKVGDKLKIPQKK